MRTRIWLGAAISVAIVAVVVYRVDLGQLSTSLQNAHWSLIALAAITLLSTQVVRAWRWQYLMESIKPIGIDSMVSATTIGAMADMLLPGRGGDVIRAYVIGRSEQVGKIASLGTIVVERVLDVITILIIAVPIAWLTNFQYEQSPIGAGLRWGICAATAVVVVFLAALAILATWNGRETPRDVARWKWLPEQWRGKISHLLREFISGLKTISNGRRLFAVIALSVALWSTFALSNFFVLHSFSLDLPYYAPFFLVVFQVLGVTLPSSPGFIGTYHAAVVAALMVFDVSQETALSVAVTMHAAFFFPYIIAGIFCLWRENLTLGSLASIDTVST